MHPAAPFWIVSAVLLAAVVKVPAAGQQCDAVAKGSNEPDGDDNVSLMAVKFATKSSPAVLTRRKQGMLGGGATADGAPLAPHRTAPSVLDADVGAAVTGSSALSKGGAGEAKRLDRRSRFPLASDLSSSMASSFAVVFVGCNDVVWFFPFAMHSRRLHFVALYMVMKEFFALFSWLVVALGHRLEDLYPGVRTERVLAIAAPALLSLYSLVLFLEWYRNDDATSDTVPDATPVLSESPPQSPRHTKLPAVAGGEQRLNLAKLSALCVIGNLDNLAIFIPGLDSGVFTGPQLAIGTFFSGVFVVAACIGASRLRAIARVAEAIPLWCILAVLAFWYTVRLLMDDERSAALL